MVPEIESLKMLNFDIEALYPYVHHFDYIKAFPQGVYLEKDSLSVCTREIEGLEKGGIIILTSVGACYLVDNYKTIESLPNNLKFSYIRGALDVIKTTDIRVWENEERSISIAILDDDEVLSILESTYPSMDVSQPYLVAESV